MHSLAFLSVTILHVLLMSSKNVEGVLQRIEFFKTSSVPNASCEQVDSIIAVKGVNGKVPNLESLQPNANGDVLKYRQWDSVGMWAFYSGVDYKVTGRGFTLTVEPEAGNCKPRAECNSEDCMIKSVRYLGNPDFDKPGLSLIAGEEGYAASGEEKYFADSMDSIEPPICATFWAFTGGESWTLYNGPRFTGTSVCVTVDPSREDTYGYANLEYVNVRSVKRGPCSPGKILSTDKNFEMSKDGKTRIYTQTHPFFKRIGSRTTCIDDSFPTTTTITTEVAETETAATKNQSGGNQTTPRSKNRAGTSIDVQFWTFMTISWIFLYLL